MDEPTIFFGCPLKKKSSAPDLFRPNTIKMIRPAAKRYQNDSFCRPEIVLMDINFRV